MLHLTMNYQVDELPYHIPSPPAEKVRMTRRVLTNPCLPRARMQTPELDPLGASSWPNALEDPRKDLI